MTSREQILGRIRAAGREPSPLPQVPLFDDFQPLTAARFQTALALMGGQWREPPGAADQLEPFIRSLFPAEARFCSAVTEVVSDYDPSTLTQPADLAALDVGVVRARFGVIETGSLWLSEQEYGINALGYLPQHLVALLDPDTLLSNLHQVYQRTDFREVNYCVLMSGPSATADIQGVLIRGAQGVRSLTVIPWHSRPD